jgi:hypothetical protein
MQAHEQRAHDEALDDGRAPDSENMEFEQIATRVELDPALTALIDSVRTAAGELEGQGAKSDRIATQLLTALGVFHRTVGRP